MFREHGDEGVSANWHNKGVRGKPTALHVACVEGHASTVRVLVENGARHNMVIQTDYNTPLHLSCGMGHADIVAFLIDSGADTTAKNAYGNTPLHAGCIGGYEEVVRLLDDRGCALLTKNNRGSTALHFACYTDDDTTSLPRFLLGKGLSIHDEDEDGTTALHVAAKKGHHEMCQLLLESGAMPTHADKSRHDASYYARTRGFDNVEQLLLMWSTKVDGRNSGAV